MRGRKANIWLVAGNGIDSMHQTDVRATTLACLKDSVYFT